MHACTVCTAQPSIACGVPKLQVQRGEMTRLRVLLPKQRSAARCHDMHRARIEHRPQPATRRYLYETMNDKEKHTVLSRMVSQGVMTTPKAEATGRWRRGGRDT